MSIVGDNKRIALQVNGGQNTLFMPVYQLPWSLSFLLTFLSSWKPRHLFRRKVSICLSTSTQTHRQKYIVQIDACHFLLLPFQPHSHCHNTARSQVARCIIYWHCMSRSLGIKRLISLIFYSSVLCTYVKLKVIFERAFLWNSR